MQGIGNDSEDCKAPSELCECMVYDGVYLNWFTGGWSPDLLFSSSVESKQYGRQEDKNINSISSYFLFFVCICVLLVFSSHPTPETVTGLTN
jgi:hypothetical protein